MKGTTISLLYVGQYVRVTASSGKLSLASKQDSKEEVTEGSDRLTYERNSYDYLFQAKRGRVKTKIVRMLGLSFFPINLFDYCEQWKNKP
jgi:hypothetical protein